jgi:hypothetical protein
MNACRISLRVKCVILGVCCAAVCLSGFSQQAGPTPEPVLRLTLEFNQGNWRLIGVEELEMVIPLTVREGYLDEGEFPAGLAFELLNADKVAVHRSDLDDPTVIVAEYLDPDGSGRFVKKTVKLEATTVSILVPAISEARFLRLSRPAEGQRLVAPATQIRDEIGVFALPTGQGQ